MNTHNYPANFSRRTTRDSRDPMINLARELRIRGFSRKTIKAYLHYNRKFLDFTRKSPKLIRSDDIKDYLDYLAWKKVSNRTLNLIINALKFYYGEIVGRSFFKSIRRPKKEQTLPVVLSKSEIKDILASVTNQKHKLILALMYAAGLRVSEVVRLRVKDLDLANNLLIVRQGKGKKDRQTLIPKNLIYILNDLVRDKNANDYIFESSRDSPRTRTSSVRGRRLTERSVQKIFLKAAKSAKIKKPATCHSLRHSFATHLLEKGVDIRYIQELLGHKRLETTQIYTKVTSQKLKEIGSPLDDL